VSGRKRYRRYGREHPRRRGRTLLWLVLILVMAGAVGLALANNAFNEDDAPPPAQASTAPTQKLLIREGLRREDVAALLDAETTISGERYLALVDKAFLPLRNGRSCTGTTRNSTTHHSSTSAPICSIVASPSAGERDPA
jgi:hypothetical protein